MDELAGKRVVILGLARQGKALARFAAEAGAQVIVSDLRPPQKLQETLDELHDLEIEVVLGEHPMTLLDKADLLAISGGVPADSPLVAAARTRGIPVTNDSQEFMKRAPATVVGITGSAGKTTTTALTGIMAQVAGRRTWVGGNIGRPLIADLHKMEPDDVVVQELSSFQLEIWTQEFGQELGPRTWQSPPVAAVLNVTPNHLDRHKTMKAYASAKANILRYQSTEDIAILSADDPGSLALQPLVRGRLRLFTLERAVPDGAFVRDGQIWLRNSVAHDGRQTAVCAISDVGLRGRHNLSNVLAAVTLADSIGVPAEAIAQAIRTFRGVEHRLEVVRTVNGVRYVNDSIATAPERVLAALQAFDEPIVLVAGGRDKDMAWAEWARQVRQRVKHVILFGELAETLANELADLPVMTRVATLAEAVAAAAATANPGDVVLFSPGGTSYDAFADFVERGEAFRILVNDLERDT
jgi:UDP-N-acetylmuramoylalanine--D-glutamate ligase